MNSSWSEDLTEDRILPNKDAAIREGTPEPQFGLKASKKKHAFSAGQLTLTGRQQGDSLLRLGKDRVPSTHQPRSSTDASHNIIPVRNASASPGGYIRSMVQQNDRIFVELDKAVGKIEKLPSTIVSSSRSEKHGVVHDSNASKVVRHSTGSLKVVQSSWQSNPAKRPLSESFHTISKKKYSDSKSDLKSRHDNPKASWGEFIAETSPPPDLPPRIITECALRVYLDNYSLTNEDKNWLFILDADEMQLQLTIQLDKNVSTGSTRRLNIRQSPSQYKQLLKTFKFETFQSLT